ncbi:MAG: hypothetical protein CVT92_02270 [Bacteroidetes bacterium HGW-Bacteroidetes-1]|jgi:heme/copper-type cytochrome/quinol oxidase subunit 2|nr:MAG: hypothetical protein CVT92_02270 [Bacteroidetes bacterium HGW-Bacteroidetes-1]
MLNYILITIGYLTIGFVVAVVTLIYDHSDDIDRDNFIKLSIFLWPIVLLILSWLSVSSFICEKTIKLVNYLKKRL